MKIKKGILIGLSLLAFFQIEKATAQKKKPNILFCMADDWGWPHAGVYGDKVVQTPTFNQLAQEGVLFNYAFASSPSCSPSRSAVITGQQNYRLDAAANLRGALDVNQPNFLFLLRAAGYEIGHFRKAWDPGNYEEGGYNEHPCGPESSLEKFIEQKDNNKPFCFWFGTSDPHKPYELGSGKKSGMDLDKIHVPSFFPDTEEVRSDIADYYFEVERWDREVGEALRFLAEKGELENTIVVMTGDQGMPFPRCKTNLYDLGVRVPLAIRWGNTLKAGLVRDEFVSLTDLAPTFLETAGLKIPKETTGKSLLPLLKGGNSTIKDRDFMVTGRERHTPAQGKSSLEGYPSRSIRTKDWLLILNLKPDRWPAGVGEQFRDGDNGATKAKIIEDKTSIFFKLSFAKRPEVELYNCKTDPDQINNLAGNPKYSTEENSLKNKLIAYLKETKDPRFTQAEPKFDTYPYNKKIIKE